MDSFVEFTDSRGSLLPIEFDLIPFKVSRIFIVQNVPVGMIRGNHAHYTTQQYLICLSGKIEVSIDNGITISHKILSKNEGLFIDKLIWDSQKFLTEDSILLVLCSNKYNIDDYITDYNEFIYLRK